MGKRKHWPPCANRFLYVKKLGRMIEPDKRVSYVLRPARGYSLVPLLHSLVETSGRGIPLK